jgi:hypothetical protein
MFRTIISSIVFSIFLISSQLTPAYAQSTSGLGISPSVQEIEAQADKTYEVDYLVENNTGIDNLLTNIEIETIQEGSIEGSANVIPFPKDKDYSSWLTVPKTQIFRTGQPTKITYQVSVPRDTTPGAYFFAIVYSGQSDETTTGGSNKLIIKSRIATLLFVNVGGDSSKKPEIENVNITPNFVDPFFDKIDISYDVRVKGASFYRPSGNLFLVADGSDIIKTLSTISSEKLILPGGKRSYTTCIKALWNNSGCAEQLEAKLPWFGKNALSLRFDYTDGGGNPQSVKAEKNIYIFPYKTTLIALLGIGGLVLASICGMKLTNKSKQK